MLSIAASSGTPKDGIGLVFCERASRRDPLRRYQPRLLAPQPIAELAVHFVQPATFCRPKNGHHALTVQIAAELTAWLGLTQPTLLLFAYLVFSFVFKEHLLNFTSIRTVVERNYLS